MLVDNEERIAGKVKGLERRAGKNLLLLLLTFHSIPLA